MKTGGNLVQLLPPGINPGEADEQLYSFNQRNLLTQYQVGAGSSVYNTVADYIYDGNSNRLQQIDSSGAQPITTTYTNDNAGLSQVLVSNDGTTTTLNLFGLDLIQQDDGSATRTLLVDGLGSARVEMVGNTIENTTTYEPFGKLLVQNGSSGTTYGYTGEQYDTATSLVYLRARYYNPNLKVFMSRDPFPGYTRLSASQNGYSYVHNNPVNLTDYTGENPLAIPTGGGIVAGCIASGVCVGIVIGVTIVVIVAVVGYLIYDQLAGPSCPVSFALRTQTQTTTQTDTETLVIPYSGPQTQVTPQGTMVAPSIPTPTPEPKETFYRFVPTNVAPLIVAGQYEMLWVPSNMPSQENFISQDFTYVDGLAASTAANQGTSMTVLQINTKPGTFDYVTDPNNARLHSGISGSSRNLAWLATKVNHNVTSYQTFVAGNGSNYLQLKREGNTLTMGFFRAATHKRYFESQINSVKSVSTH